MPAFVTTIITHTPFWVWLVLALLIGLGLISTRTRVVGLGKLLPLPVLLVSATVYYILSTGFSPPTLIGLAVGALAGLASGLALERRKPALPLGNGQIELAGEWTSLLVILAVFISRYAGAVTSAMAPAIAGGPALLLTIAAISAFSSAMFVTRTVLRLRVLKAAPIPAPSTP